MRILLSNDDGVFHPGLAALYEAAATLGEVTVVAPADPQNATSQAISLSRPLAVRRVRVPGPPEFEAVSVDGLPADCVRLALRKMLSVRPDLVVTGINAGANAGVNVLYSGTVAAAAEAAMLGVPAVAFSVGSHDAPNDYARAGRLCGWILRRLLDGVLVPGDLLNVNIPVLQAGLPRGVRVVPQATASLADSYLDVGVGGSEAYRLSHEYSFARQEGTDLAALADGYVAVTPLHINRTHARRLEALADVEWADMPR